ncbi:T9SS type A sorting domain-containing protein [Dyadobacter chenwenxiniae]|uniref:T9SS type A sorting domain-containing protein n=1 Tax=Dyadobacter chenwenxiniae TaxID=2906456 RepID=A0A9X1PK33_9BACT|nr:T9SS type A sorting domain-containing protein [Dyadobacter chenwenxiniae]MCF0062378.1 T9SS type A sorting domain-containing protein [Dyadobacter chenwenxiniae]UON83867.1 T9SS type A sorting domain-containing protein [Dyadobacter chenwenxiniae]
MKFIYTKTFASRCIFIIVLLLCQLAAEAVVIPKAPSALAATAISATQINLVWVDNAKDETGFELERSVDGLKFVKVADLAANIKAYSNTGLTASTRYWYRIRAKNSAGKSAYSNIASATTFLIAPNAPGKLAAISVSTVQVNVSWEDNALNESGFQLERSLNGTAFTKIADLGPNIKSYQNTGLDAATTYYYRVRAVNAAGASAYSNVDSATTDNLPVPDMPENFTAVPIAPDVVELRWSAVSENTKEVIIERSKSVTNQFVQIGKVAANVLQFQDKDSLANTNYYYRIKAINAGGSSPYSLISIVLANAIITGNESLPGGPIIYSAERTLIIELNKSAYAQLQLYNVSGTRQLEAKIGTSSRTSLAHLARGIYIVRIQTGKEVISRKVVLLD